MEASTLQKKKNTISKGKLKKTIKNVLCQPDPVFWPTISDKEEKVLETALSKYKVHIPEYKKLHWNELKLLPRDERPKPPKITKVEGLMFGLSKCCESINNKACSAIIIESAVNPRAIVHPILEACVSAKVPVVCLNGLRKFCENNFGIPTSCLGTKKNHLTDISGKIKEFCDGKWPQEKIELKMEDVEMTDDVKHDKSLTTTKDCPYLYRTSKKVRVFVPPSEGHGSKGSEKFVGQDFIEFSMKKLDKPANSKAFMKMMVKRISNNPNRTKVK